MERNCLSDHVPPKTSCGWTDKSSPYDLGIFYSKVVEIPIPLWTRFFVHIFFFFVPQLLWFVMAYFVLSFENSMGELMIALSSNIKSSTGAKTFPQAPATFIHIVYPQASSLVGYTFPIDQNRPKPFFIIYINSIRNGALGQFFHWKYSKRYSLEFFRQRGSGQKEQKIILF